MSKRLTIAGVGCSLLDYVYKPVDFNSSAFKKYQSQTMADGGLEPGTLIFAEELESFANQDFTEILKTLVGGRSPETVNLGGPAVVALIHAAQMLYNQNVSLKFYGAAGKDQIAEQIIGIINKTPLDISNYRFFEDCSSPFTNVLSDPQYDNGQGERSFINNIGAARKLSAEHLDHDFFNSDFCVFGGTALVPQIHDHLSSLLQKAKEQKSFTFVNTVYDFRNQKLSPENRWPMGDSDKSYALIDLLITDAEEAFRLSGTDSFEKALDFFEMQGSKNVIITHGSKNIYCQSNGGEFLNEGRFQMPISQMIANKLQSFDNKGDTTGCGDNFAGGVLTALAKQKIDGKSKLNLRESVALGAVSGGYACFYMGGTQIENEAGEKAKAIAPYLNAYRQQITK